MPLLFNHPLTHKTDGKKGLLANPELTIKKKHLRGEIKQYVGKVA
jgi:hypothetical protein